MELRAWNNYRVKEHRRGGCIALVDVIIILKYVLAWRFGNR